MLQYDNHRYKTMEDTRLAFKEYQKFLKFFLEEQVFTLND